MKATQRTIYATRSGRRFVHVHLARVSTAPARVRRSDLALFKQQIDEELEFISHGTLSTADFKLFPYADRYLSRKGAEEVAIELFKRTNLPR